MWYNEAVKKPSLDPNEYSKFLKHFTAIEEHLNELANMTEDYEMGKDEQDDIFEHVDKFESLIVKIQSNAFDK